MIKVELITRGRELVREVMLPDFSYPLDKPLPEAITWGSRFFVLKEQNSHDWLPVYVEGVCLSIDAQIDADSGMLR